ncbi:MAG: DegT/DnrJ/EryC1/StrS family aminotransferase [Oscillospiraceae bacterium]|nr:DegT/DnrJ/EryC1/StrS family aminotransferase [Oscillospiraceae bacterium]MBQ3224261.1 DegT/DnrJ/EryC1/StrS family aminotransferase [Oscillospiraceae bacterium]
MSKLALFGGEPAVTYVGTGKNDGSDMFKWPVVTDEDREAVLEVINSGTMSKTDVTKEFEKEFCAWVGAKYALGTCNGTAALHAAMYGVGLGRGDELICPSITYWASCTGAYSLGATVVFADIDPDTLCLDPKKLEEKITDKTKAIMVVHYCGHPADMDAIMAIAKKHNLKVIEDVSHAQGGKYKGRMLGTIGDIGAASLMSGKSLAIGEAGILWTNDREIYERATAFGSYERFITGGIEIEYLKPLAGLPLGGYKHRMHQVSAAMGRVQLKHYDARCAEINKAVKYFEDKIKNLPGIKLVHVDESDGSTMAGWYVPVIRYTKEELGGLSISRFCEAMCAEGVKIHPGINRPLHTHPVHGTADVYNDGKPVRLAFANKDVREMDKDLEVSKDINKKTFFMPWFKHFRPEIIDQYAAAFAKVIENYKELLADDKGDPEILGGWHRFNHSDKTK